MKVEDRIFSYLKKSGRQGVPPHAGLTPLYSSDHNNFRARLKPDPNRNIFPPIKESIKEIVVSLSISKLTHEINQKA
jgi:hypothetical protein